MKRKRTPRAPSGKNRQRRRERGLVGFVLFLSAFPLFEMVFRAKWALLDRDLSRVYLPAKQYLAESFAAIGAPPEWNWHAFGGSPFLADPNFGSFNPFNLSLLLPFTQFTQTFSVFLFLQLSWASGGMYLWLRSYRVPRSSAAVFAGAFILSGALLSSLNIVHVFGAVCSLPWFGWLLRSYLNGPGIAKGIWLGGLIGFPLLAGDPTYAYLFGIAYFICAAMWMRKKGRSLRPTLFLLPPVASLLAAAAQMLPTLQLLSHSSRTGMGLAEAQEFSFHPARLLELFFPLPFGAYRPENNYWGGQFTDPGTGGQPFLFCLYLGVIPSLFCLVRGLRRFGLLNFRPRLPRWKSVSLELCAFVLLLASMGKYSPVPLFRWAFDFLPFWNMFRYPERLELIWCCLLFLLAAREFSVWSRGTTLLARQRLITICFVICLFFYLVGHFLSPLAANTFLPSAAHALAVLLACLLTTLYAEKNRFLARNLNWVWLLILWIDLATIAPRLVPKQNANVLKLSEKDPLMKIVKDVQFRQPEIRKGAAYRITHALISDEEAGVLPLSQEDSQRDVISRSVIRGIKGIRPNVHMLYGLSSAVGYASLEPSDLLEVWERAGSRKDQASLFADLMSVRYVPYLTRTGEIEVGINDDAVPYLEGIEKWFSATSEEDAERLLFSTSPTEYILETTERFPPNLALVEISEVSHSFDLLRFHLKIKDPKDGFAIVHWSESYNPSWSARIGDKRLPIIRANRWDQAILIDLKVFPGVNEMNVLLEFDNPLFDIGAGLSLLWAGFALGTLAIPFWPTRGKSRTS